MTKTSTSNLKIGWDWTGGTTWKKFPLVEEIDLVIPERELVEVGGVGADKKRSIYVHAKPKETTIKGLLQGWQFIAAALGNDSFGAGLHTLIDEIGGATDYLGKDGVKLIDIAMDDSTAVRLKAEKSFVTGFKITAEYGKAPFCEYKVMVPKVTTGDPSGTDVDNETLNIVTPGNCHVYFQGHEIETAKVKVEFKNNGKHAETIGLEQQTSAYFTNWEIMVKITGIFDSGPDSGNGFAWGTLPADLPKNIDVAFGTTNAKGGTHWIYFEFDQLLPKTPEIKFKGDEFVMLEWEFTPGMYGTGFTKTAVTAKDSNWNGGTDAGYW